MTYDRISHSIISGTAPLKLRALIARGLAPIPPDHQLRLLIHLLNDEDSEIARQAHQTIESWDEDDLCRQLQNSDCDPNVLEYYAFRDVTEHIAQAIITNPSSPGKTIAILAEKVPEPLLKAILENSNRIIESPEILESVDRNLSATPEIRRLAQEIKAEFLGNKRTEYTIEDEIQQEDPALKNDDLHPVDLELETDIPFEDLTLESLPLDGEERESAVNRHVSSMTVREKFHYALFGSREIRTMLIRDSNKEVARTVLRSPKIAENEIESIAAMRNIGEDILREIGNSKEWTKSYAVVQNLIRNPKTPIMISQRLMFRLRAQDLSLLTRDRSIPDAVRNNAKRILKQRTTTGSGR
ncbi:MAG TPA: hypothetical protein VLL97_03795 [Acidobacteriota bacterium]|nr:hypothetical protein [Acidobacteriota bacterium]